MRCADEVDAIGAKRYESQSGGEREIQRTMLELLNQMDGFDARGDVKVNEPPAAPTSMSSYLGQTSCKLSDNGLAVKGVICPGQQAFEGRERPQRTFKGAQKQVTAASAVHRS